MNVTPQRVWMLVLENGACSVEEWLHSKVRDVTTRAKISRQIDKLARGIFGDWKRTEDGGLFELRLDFGPGYRVYFGRMGATDIVAICGGDKSTQSADIRRSRYLWDAYLGAGAPVERLKGWGSQD